MFVLCTHGFDESAAPRDQGLENEMTYDKYWIMERLGSEATEADAKAAYEAAEDWYNNTPKSDVLAWYFAYCNENMHAQPINDGSQLVENWNEIVIFNCAVSQNA